MTWDQAEAAPTQSKRKASKRAGFKGALKKMAKKAGVKKATRKAKGK